MVIQLTHSDIADFQAGYPGQSNNLKLRANLDFYRNEAPMQPDDLRYEEFMRKYAEDWYELESNQ
jgi:hypothetical protein